MKRNLAKNSLMGAFCQITNKMKVKIIIDDTEKELIKNCSNIEELRNLILEKIDADVVSKFKRSQKILKEQKRKEERLKNHNKFALARRKKLINKETPFEKTVEKLLRKTKVEFSKQVPFHTEHSFYIADFYVPSMRTILEIDGKYHEDLEQKIKDRNRDTWFLKQGIMVKRILNEEIPSLDPSILIEFLKSKGIHYKEYYEEKL